MSKTYRYSPEDEEVENLPSWERPDEATEEVEVPAPKPRKHRRKGKAAPEFAPMTPEWAVALMRERVESVTSLLVDQRVIERHEREDYAQIIYAHICRILPDYDPEHKNAKGKTASVERYLSVAIDNVVKNIKMHVARRRKNIPIVSMLPLKDFDKESEGDEENEDGKLCETDDFGDRCRHIEEMWLRMDIEELSKMLTPGERLTLSLRLAEFTFPEIAEELSRYTGTTVDRHYIMDVVMENIRYAARKCGFIPYSELRGEKS